MKQEVLVICALLAAIGSGCSKKEPTTDKDSNGRTAYVSPQEEYVQALQQEVSIDDPDALLDDLNDSTGDNSENAERVRLKSVEASPVQNSDASALTDAAAPSEKVAKPQAKTSTEQTEQPTQTVESAS